MPRPLTKNEYLDQRRVNEIAQDETTAARDSADIWSDQHEQCRLDALARDRAREWAAHHAPQVPAQPQTIVPAERTRWQRSLWQ